ncbi:MFS transporter [Nesterenkonia natronophila]|uniref:MFS transporter n=1 Tax=Nesterenkonia natronophila TaxID=2174932 RepID=A0A3A4F697_9MICC|nr:MFS transporter [Nesterenkonia natronophila]
MLAGLCTTQIVAWGILYYAFPVLSARIAEDTGWTTTSVTVAYSASLVVSALLGIPVGKILDRSGPRLVMTVGSVLSVLARHMWIYGLLAVSTAALAVDATNSVWLIMIAMVAGVGRGIATLLKATAVPDRWGPRAYGRLSGVFSAPVMLGAAVAPALGAWLAELLGSWELMYLVLAGMGALAMVALLFSVPEKRPGAGRPR